MAEGIWPRAEGILHGYNYCGARPIQGPALRLTHMECWSFYTTEQGQAVEDNALQDIISGSEEIAKVFSRVSVLVLDEADRLLEPSFEGAPSPV